MAYTKKYTDLMSDHQRLIEEVEVAKSIVADVPRRREFLRLASRLEDAIGVMLSYKDNRKIDIAAQEATFSTISGLLKDLTKSFRDTSIRRGQLLADENAWINQLNFSIFRIDNLFADFLTSLISLDVTQPKLPVEAHAPIRVIVQDSKIKLSSSKNHVGTITDNSVERLRSSINRIFERTMFSLSQVGNADPRLAPACIGLLEELSVPHEAMSIEAIGLNWKIFSDTLAATQETLPEALLSQLKQVATTVAVILAQYEEWQLYLAAEMGALLTKEQTIELARATASFSEELSNYNEIVEGRIVDRLKIMTDNIMIGIVQSDALAVATIGSMSNLLSTFSRLALSTLASLPPEGQASASVVLIDVSIRLIKDFAPTFAEFSPLRWVIDVHTQLSKYTSDFKDIYKSK